MKKYFLFASLLTMLTGCDVYTFAHKYKCVDEKGVNCTVLSDNLYQKGDKIYTVINGLNQAIEAPSSDYKATVQQIMY